MTNAARGGKYLITLSEPLSEATLVRTPMVTWIANLAHHLGELADFLEALPDDDPLIQAEARAWRPGRQGWHDRRIREWFDYMAGLPARESGDDSD